VRRLHIDVAPQTPDIRSARVGRPDNTGARSSKEDLKDRIISIVRNGADGSHYQALIQETCAWLKEQSSEEVSKMSRELIVIDDISKHWDLRALYLLLTRYHQMHKEEQAATVNLHEKTRLYQDALRRAEKRQQEIAELKQTIEDLRDEMESQEVKWAIREKQLAT
jgi:chromosome segregation ATPase